MALAQYSPALFDTITWSADSARVNRGAVVWTFSCKKCHGETGHGDAKYVMNVQDPESGEMKPDTLVPPDFHQANWIYATDRQGLVKFIYTGSGQKPMPHWGISGLKPRDIDAVAAYIQQVVLTAEPADSTQQPAQ